MVELLLKKIQINLRTLLLSIIMAGLRSRDKLIWVTGMANGNFTMKKGN